MRWSDLKFCDHACCNVTGRFGAFCLNLSLGYRAEKNKPSKSSACGQKLSLLQ